VFREEAEEARALAEADLLSKVTVAAREDRRASAWLLSHGHRDDWGDKTRIEHSGEGAFLVMLADVESAMGLSDPDAGE
jgi:mRNA degradation ribonuclease J1/J2